MNRRNAIGSAEDFYFHTTRPFSIEAVKGSPSIPISPPEWNSEASYFNHPSQVQSQSPTFYSRISTSFFSSSSSSPKSPRTHSVTNPCTYNPPLPSSPFHQESRRDTQLITASVTPQSNSSTAPAAPPPINSHSASASTSTHTTAANPNSSGNNNEAASKLAEALDDFLGDVERKFKGISEEILARLDEMTERCDRLESELSRKEIPTKKDGAGSTV